MCPFCVELKLHAVPLDLFEPRDNEEGSFQKQIKGADVELIVKIINENKSGAKSSFVLVGRL